MPSSSPLLQGVHLAANNAEQSLVNALPQNAHRGPLSLTVGQSADHGCNRSGGAIKIIACIEDQEIMHQFLADLRRKEQNTSIPPLLVPPTRAPLRHCLFSAGWIPHLHRSISRDVTEQLVGTNSFVPRFRSERYRSARPTMRSRFWIAL